MGTPSYQSLAVPFRKRYPVIVGRTKAKAGGGWPAVMYSLRRMRQAGGFFRVYSRLRSRNACKTCALGMGGQSRGMVNEIGHFPEVCKKSIQAQTGDMDGVIAESYIDRTSIDDLGRLSSLQLERLGRLTFPLIAEPGDSHYRRISWEEAMTRSAAALQSAAAQQVFFYASGRSSNEAAFLMQLVARAYGTANIHNCSYYCHSASGVALSRVYGSGTSSVVLDDLRQADLAMVVGANPASNHPRLITQLVNLRRRGGKVIVINPLKELGLVRFKIPSDWRSMLFGSDVSDLYLQPNIGSDVALLKALLKGVIEAEALDREFIESHTTGWAGLQADVLDASWESLVSASGVPKESVEKAAQMICGARKGIFLWAMGLTHHTNGVDNILALSNLALARGWLGKPGCGLLPIRGHSNVQGVGSVGVTPKLKAAFGAKMEELFHITIPSDPGQDTYASMVAASKGRIQASVQLGGNLFASNPDRDWASAALRRIPFTVTVSTKLNEGHIHGRAQTQIILPALARDEESQSTTQESMFNYVRLSEGGTPAVAGEMRSEVRIIAELAERILPSNGIDWAAFRSHRKLREAIGKAVPGFDAIGQIDDTLKEFQIGGRTFHTPQFNTPDGKAHFHVTPTPSVTLKENEFRLMTIRSEGQFNTVVYDEEDPYRGTTTRQVVMISSDDLARLGLNEGDTVTVETDCGSMTVTTSVIDIPPGNLAMYYPEANVLVPRSIDPASHTPAFKSVVARIKWVKS